MIKFFELYIFMTFNINFLLIKCFHHSLAIFSGPLIFNPSMILVILVYLMMSDAMNKTRVNSPGGERLVLWRGGCSVRCMLMRRGLSLSAPQAFRSLAGDGLNFVLR
jgi:hypothetical protein